ncbi:MAG: hypothetical protein HQK81_11000 [Desulfovibrionaceae bacterium]|nr:hypothetical protein [Desulfovibrionaceae bacterium]MBF0514569.1 hypothetical protein [Desulfovibrionaceae bacterium]
MVIALHCGGKFESMPTQRAIWTACRQLAVQILSAKGITTGEISAVTGLTEEAIIRVIKSGTN